MKFLAVVNVKNDTISAKSATNLKPLMVMFAAETPMVAAVAVSKVIVGQSLPSGTPIISIPAFANNAVAAEMVCV